MPRYVPLARRECEQQCHLTYPWVVVPCRHGGKLTRVRSERADFLGAFAALQSARARCSAGPRTKNPRRVFLSARARARRHSPTCTASPQCTRAPHTPACGSGAAWRREWRGQSRFFEFSRLPGATKGRSSQLRAAAAAAAPGRDDVHDLVLHVDPEVQLHLVFGSSNQRTFRRPRTTYTAASSGVFARNSSASASSSLKRS